MLTNTSKATFGGVRYRDIISSTFGFAASQGPSRPDSYQLAQKLMKLARVLAEQGVSRQDRQMLCSFATTSDIATCITHRGYPLLLSKFKSEVAVSSLLRSEKRNRKENGCRWEDQGKETKKHRRARCRIFVSTNVYFPGWFHNLVQLEQ